MKSLKLFFGLCVYALTIAVVVAAVSFYWVSQEFTKPGPLQTTTLVEIESGSGLRSIAAKLSEAGIIKNPYIFMAGTMAMGAQGDMKAGEYEIPAAVSASAVMTLIREGKVYGRRVTIREGLTSYEVQNILAEVKDLKAVPAEPAAEGSLLPETYDYRKDETTLDVQHRMEEAMRKTLDELWEKRAGNLPFNTKEQAVTLASIVEKETGHPEERKRVAGVFINRLRQGIALQTDPTVIYAITQGKPKNDGKGPLGRRLLLKDLEIDSPYNTYKFPGLPPGPIANPGRASLEAVLNPEEHSFIYFVADGSGGHVFASTLEEHNRNVQQWRKIRRELQN